MRNALVALAIFAALSCFSTAARADLVRVVVTSGDIRVDPIEKIQRKLAPVPTGESCTLSDEGWTCNEQEKNPATSVAKK